MSIKSYDTRVLDDIPYFNNNQIISEYSNNIVIIWDVNEGQEIKKIDCNLSYAKLGSIINIGSTMSLIVHI